MHTNIKFGKTKKAKYSVMDALWSSSFFLSSFCRLQVCPDSCNIVKRFIYFQFNWNIHCIHCMQWQFFFCNFDDRSWKSEIRYLVMISFSVWVNYYSHVINTVFLWVYLRPRNHDQQEDCWLDDYPDVTNTLHKQSEPPTVSTEKTGCFHWELNWSILMDSWLEGKRVVG